MRNDAVLGRALPLDRGLGPLIPQTHLLANKFLHGALVHIPALLGSPKLSSPVSRDDPPRLGCLLTFTTGLSRLFLAKCCGFFIPFGPKFNGMISVPLSIYCESVTMIAANRETDQKQYVARRDAVISRGHMTHTRTSPRLPFHWWQSCIYADNKFTNKSRNIVLNRSQSAEGSDTRHRHSDRKHTQC